MLQRSYGYFLALLWSRSSIHLNLSCATVFQFLIHSGLRPDWRLSIHLIFGRRKLRRLSRLEICWIRNVLNKNFIDFFWFLSKKQLVKHENLLSFDFSGPLKAGFHFTAASNLIFFWHMSVFTVFTSVSSFVITKAKALQYYRIQSQAKIWKIFLFLKGNKNPWKRNFLVSMINWMHLQKEKKSHKLFFFKHFIESTHFFNSLTFAISFKLFFLHPESQRKLSYS